MEEKQIVVSPRCPTHGWIDANGYTRPTEERSPCVRFVEASRDGNYFIREANFERSHILEEIVQPEPQHSEELATWERLLLDSPAMTYTIRAQDFIGAA